MTAQLTHGSLFAGIGGFDAGFRESGMQVKWQVEREPFCRAILRTRFPEAELLNDVRECGKHNLGAVDVLTAGFPCQDLSVAGKRAGLAGARSGLFWEVVRILGELRPPWFVLENVPGLFSSNEGRDFAVVLESLDELGYGLAWRVLDSQFFGVAQRRRRVFIVGSFGKPCPQEVLFESEGGEGDFAEGGEERAELAYEVAASLRGAGGGPRGFNLDAETGLAVTLSSGNGVTSNRPGRRREDDYNLAVSYALRNDPGGTGQGHNTTFVCGPGPSRALTASKSSHGRYDPNEQEFVVIQDVRDIEKGQHGLGIEPGGLCPTLGVAERHGVATCGDSQHQERTRELSGNAGRNDEHDGGTDNERSSADTNGVRDFTGLPLGLDSARYRALGNAVTAKVAYWIGRRIVACHERTGSCEKL